MNALEEASRLLEETRARSVGNQEEEEEKKKNLTKPPLRCLWQCARLCSLFYGAAEL
jgi:predicted metal-binding protein